VGKFSHNCECTSKIKLSKRDFISIYSPEAFVKVWSGGVMWDCGGENYCLMTKAIPRRHMDYEYGHERIFEGDS